MKISVGQSEDSFLAEADNFEVIGSDKTAQAVIAESRKRYATPVEDLNKPVKEKTLAEKTNKPKSSPKNQQPREKVEGTLPI